MKNWNPSVRVAIYLLLVLIPVLGLLLLGRDFISDNIVVPVEYELWLAGLAIRALPQPILWGIVCGLVLIIALSSLLAGKAPSESVHREEPMRTRSERVAFWTLQMRMAARGSYYSKLRFADFFSKLILDILFYTGEVNQEQYEIAIKTGVLDLPPEVLVFLKIRLTPFHEFKSPPFFFRLTLGIRRLFGRAVTPKSTTRATKSGSAPDPDLKTAVEYLEHELEVNSNQYGD
jgi:hypothetical protein